jgi:tetratricopeptide (TPR) repeat protein
MRQCVPIAIYYIYRMTSSMEIFNLKRILTKNPKSLLFARLADGLRATEKNLDEALRVANTGLETNPNFLQGRLARGRILMEKGDLLGAKIDFEVVVKRDPFCLSAMKLLIEASEKLEQPEEAEIYVKILSAFEQNTEIKLNIPVPTAVKKTVPVKEPDLIPFEKPKKIEQPTSLAAALDDVLAEGESEDEETEIAKMLLKAADNVIKNANKPMPLPEASSVVLDKVPSPAKAKPAASEPELAPYVPPAQAAPDLDDIISEQLSSKVEDIPDLTSDMDSLLASAESEPELAPYVPSAQAAPNLDDIISEQLSSKVEDIPDLTGDMDSLLASAESEPELAPYVPPAQAAPDLDDIISEQLASKVEDIPDLTGDMDSLLASAESEPELAPYVPPAQAAPDLDDIISEQLASKVEDIPDLTGDMDSLLASVDESELVPYMPLAQIAEEPHLEKMVAAAPNLDDIISEQLASKVETIPDLTKDMDSLLASVDESDLVPYIPLAQIAEEPHLEKMVAAAPNLDDIISEQLASKVETVPDLTKDMDSLLASVEVEDQPEEMIKNPTLTLAELYMNQGLPQKAAEVYRELLARDSSNEDLKTKLAFAEAQA